MSKSNSPLSRSEIMSRVRSANTSPELIVRKALWAAGLRYRLHDKRLPGTPDLVFKGRRTVIFVHGCFWHAHQNCSRHRIPKTRTEWWKEKFARNRARDEQAISELEHDGWKVIVVWECEIKRKEIINNLVDTIKKA